VFHLPMRAGVALLAHAFPLPVGAGGAHHATAFHLPVRAGVTLRAVVFQLPVGVGVALRAVVFHLAVGARVALPALVFLPSVPLPRIFPHYSPPRALTSALQAPRLAKTESYIFEVTSCFGLAEKIQTSFALSSPRKPTLSFSTVLRARRVADGVRVERRRWSVVRL